MNGEKLHADMHISCEVISIEEIGCSYRATLSLDEHYVALLDIEMEKELYHKIKDLKEFIIFARDSNDCFTLRGTAIIESSFSLQRIDNSNDSKVQICLWISDIFVGVEYAVEGNDELLFNGFSCRFTDVFELLGLYPYKIVNTGSEWLFKETTIDDDTKTMEFDGGYSCFVAPYIYKKDSDYVFSMEGRLNYFATEFESIEDLKEKVRMLELFFEVLSGESITALDIKMEKGECSFEYLGLCNYPKEKLRGLYNGFDSKWYPRKSIFKLSDWQNTGKDVIEIFAGLAKDNLLAMESYKQVLLDEEIKIVTYNKFLKIMQMIEGIMRDSVLQQDIDDFNNKKQEILAKIENDEDRNFVKKYCVNNGESFRKCLKKITRECLKVLSDAGSDRMFRNYEKLIEKIINDRDAYTHALRGCRPVMNEEETLAVNCCYMAFFRIIILKRLGVSNELIRMRFMFNRKFVEAYRALFGLSIKNMGENHNTGEFDDMMSDYI